MRISCVALFVLMYEGCGRWGGRYCGADGLGKVLVLEGALHPLFKSIVINESCFSLLILDNCVCEFVNWQ